MFSQKNLNEFLQIVFIAADSQIEADDRFVFADLHKEINLRIFGTLTSIFL